MGVQRDGSVGTGDDDRDTAVIAYFGDGATSQGDVTEALVFAGVNNAPVVFFCQNNQWAISEPIEKQTRAPLWHRARGFGFPGIRVDGNDVLAVLRRHQGRARRAPASGQGPTFIEAVHLPDGRAHHLRRPHQVPRLRRGRGVEAPRPDRAVQALPDDAPAAPTPTSSTPSRRRPTSSARSVRERLPGAARPAPAPTCSTTSTPTRTRSCERAARPSSSATRPRSKEVRTDGRRPTLAKAHHQRACAAAMENDPKVVLMGEDIGKLGGVFRVTEGLQKDFGEDRVIDTPLAESGIVGTAIGLALRGYRPVVRDPVRRVRLPGVRPDRQPGRQAARPHAWATSRCRSSSASRSAAASAPSSTTASPPRPTSRTPPGCGSSPAPTRTTRYWMIQQAIADRRPGHLLRAQAPLLGEGRGRRRARRRAAAARAARACARAPTSRCVAYGPMVKTCLQAAAAAAGGGRSLEVIDLRSLSPLDDADHPRLGAQDRPRRRRARGARPSSASAPRSRRSSPSGRSTPSRRRCCGSAATTCPTRRAGSRRSSSPTSTACSTPSTARSPH